MAYQNRLPTISRILQEARDNDFIPIQDLKEFDNLVAEVVKRFNALQADDGSNDSVSQRIKEIEYHLLDALIYDENGNIIGLNVGENGEPIEGEKSLNTLLNLLYEEYNLLVSAMGGDPNIDNWKYELERYYNAAITVFKDKINSLFTKSANTQSIESKHADEDNFMLMDAPKMTGDTLLRLNPDTSAYLRTINVDITGDGKEIVVGDIISPVTDSIAVNMKIQNGKFYFDINLVIDHDKIYAKHENIITDAVKDLLKRLNLRFYKYEYDEKYRYVITISGNHADHYGFEFEGVFVAGYDFSSNNFDLVNHNHYYKYELTSREYPAYNVVYYTKSSQLLDPDNPESDTVDIYVPNENLKEFVEGVEYYERKPRFLLVGDYDILANNDNTVDEKQMYSVVENGKYEKKIGIFNINIDDSDIVGEDSSVSKDDYVRANPRYWLDEAFSHNSYRSGKAVHSFEKQTFAYGSKVFEKTQLRPGQVISTFENNSKIVKELYTNDPESEEAMYKRSLMTGEKVFNDLEKRDTLEISDPIVLPNNVKLTTFIKLQSGTILASGGNSGINNTGIYESYDGGLSWYEFVSDITPTDFYQFENGTIVATDFSADGENGGVHVITEKDGYVEQLDDRSYNKSAKLFKFKDNIFYICHPENGSLLLGLFDKNGSYNGEKRISDDIFNRLLDNDWYTNNINYSKCFINDDCVLFYGIPGVILKSYDLQTWEEIDITQFDMSYHNDYNPAYIEQFGNKLLYVKEGRDSLWASDDNGDTWRRILDHFPNDVYNFKKINDYSFIIGDDADFCCLYKIDNSGNIVNVNDIGSTFGNGGLMSVHSKNNFVILFLDDNTYLISYDYGKTFSNPIAQNFSPAEAARYSTFIDDKLFIPEYYLSASNSRLRIANLPSVGIETTIVEDSLDMEIKYISSKLYKYDINEYPEIFNDYLIKVRIGDIDYSKLIIDKIDKDLVYLKSFQLAIYRDPVNSSILHILSFPDDTTPENFTDGKHFFQSFAVNIAPYDSGVYPTVFSYPGLATKEDETTTLIDHTWLDIVSTKDIAVALSERDLYVSFDGEIFEKVNKDEVDVSDHSNGEWKLLVTQTNKFILYNKKKVYYSTTGNTWECTIDISGKNEIYSDDDGVVIPVDNIEISNVTTFYLNQNMVVIHYDDTTNSESGEYVFKIDDSMFYSKVPSEYLLENAKENSVWNMCDSAINYSIDNVKIAFNAEAYYIAFDISDDEMNYVVILSTNVTGSTIGKGKTFDYSGEKLVDLIYWPETYDPILVTDKKCYIMSMNDGKMWTQSDLTSGNIQCITMANDGTLVASCYNNKGIYYSTDNGRTWTQSSLTSGNIQCITMANDGTLLAGSFNSHGIYYSTDNGRTWTQSSLTSDSIYCITVANDGTLFAGSFVGHGIYYSTDNGRTWTQSSLTSKQIYCIAVANDGTLVTANYYDNDNKGIYYSVDNGVTWVQSNLINNLNSSITPYITVANDGTLVAGSNGSGIYYSTDNGKTWTQSSLTSGNIQCITMANDGTLLAGSNGIYYSTDNGKTWTQSDLTTGTINCITVANDGTLVAGSYSNNGIYYSTDNGKTWVQSNLTSVSIHCITVVNDGTLFAGSFVGHGIYYSTKNITPNGYTNFSKVFACMDKDTTSAATAPTGAIFINCEDTSGNPKTLWTHNRSYPVSSSDIGLLGNINDNTYLGCGQYKHKYFCSISNNDTTIPTFSYFGALTPSGNISLPEGVALSYENSNLKMTTMQRNSDLNNSSMSSWKQVVLFIDRVSGCIFSFNNPAVNSTAKPAKYRYKQTIQSIFKVRNKLQSPTDISTYKQIEGDITYKLIQTDKLTYHNSPIFDDNYIYFDDKPADEYRTFSSTYPGRTAKISEVNNLDGTFENRSLYIYAENSIVYKRYFNDTYNIHWDTTNKKWISSIVESSNLIHDMFKHNNHYFTLYTNTSTNKMCILIDTTLAYEADVIDYFNVVNDTILISAYTEDKSNVGVAYDPITNTFKEYTIVDSNKILSFNEVYSYGKQFYVINGTGHNPDIPVESRGIWRIERTIDGSLVTTGYWKGTQLNEFDFIDQLPSRMGSFTKKIPMIHTCFDGMEYMLFVFTGFSQDDKTTDIKVLALDISSDYVEELTNGDPRVHEIISLIDKENIELIDDIDNDVSYIDPEYGIIVENDDTYQSFEKPLVKTEYIQVPITNKVSDIESTDKHIVFGSAFGDPNSTLLMINNGVLTVIDKRLPNKVKSFGIELLNESEYFNNIDLSSCDITGLYYATNGINTSVFMCVHKSGTYYLFNASLESILDSSDIVTFDMVNTSFTSNDTQAIMNYIVDTYRLLPNQAVNSDFEFDIDGLVYDNVESHVKYDVDNNVFVITNPIIIKDSLFGDNTNKVQKELVPVVQTNIGPCEVKLNSEGQIELVNLKNIPDCEDYYKAFPNKMENFESDSESWFNIIDKGFDNDGYIEISNSLNINYHISGIIKQCSLGYYGCETDDSTTKKYIDLFVSGKKIRITGDFEPKSIRLFDTEVGVFISRTGYFINSVREVIEYNYIYEMINIPEENGIVRLEDTRYFRQLANQFGSVNQAHFGKDMIFWNGNLYCAFESFDGYSPELLTIAIYNGYNFVKPIRMTGRSTPTNSNHKILFDLNNYLGVICHLTNYKLFICDKLLNIVIESEDLTKLPTACANTTNLQFEDKKYYYSINDGDSLHSINQSTGAIETQSFNGITFLTNFMFGFDRYWKDANSSNFKDIANRLSEQGVPVNQYIKAMGYITFNDLPVLISGFKLIGNDNDSANTIKFYVDKNYRLPINPSSMKLPSGVSSESSKSEILTYVKSNIMGLSLSDAQFLSYYKDFLTKGIISDIDSDTGATLNGPRKITKCNLSIVFDQE